MQKQQIIGISLITLILVLYIGVILPKYQPAPVKQPPKGTLAQNTTGSSTLSNETTGSEPSPPLALDTTLLQHMQEIVVDSDLYRARFTTLGGRLTSFRLKDITAEKFLNPADLE